MNPQERIRVGELWVGLAQMFGKEITRPALHLMLNSVDDLDALKVEQVLNDWAMNSKTGRHPLPAEIREKLNPVSEAKDIGRNEIMRVREAISKFGWPNPKEAEEYIGPTGWRYIQRCGGWQHVCENLGLSISESTFLAQGRDAIESEIKLGRAGYDTERPMLEQPNKSMLSLVGDLAKQKALPGGKNEKS